MKSTEQILAHFERTTADILSLEEFRKRLATGKPMNIKYGVDVTAPFLHLGHAVNLWMMRYLQELGHKVQFLIGDFTTKIGDPTGRSESRPVISDEDIAKNATEFINQVGRVLITDDPRVFEVRRNSEWFSSMHVNQFLGLLTNVTHARLVSRDMFQKRISEGHDIYMHEMLYPILQGYDSVMLRSDLTIVGSDQLFNEMMGRFFQERNGQSPQIIITTKITPGIDGKAKQSKSLNNYIALADNPRQIFGKAMSMPDGQIFDWMRVYTDIAVEEIQSLEASMQAGVNPRDAKLKLAFALVARYYGNDIAKEEMNWFLRSFSANAFPDDAPLIKIEKPSAHLMEVLSMCMPQESKSELRRLLSQDAVELNGSKVKDHMAIITIGNETQKLKIGKRRFFKIQSV